MYLHRLLLALPVLAYSTISAFAWGAEGHRIIALIAAKHLSPSAQTQIAELLGGTDASAALVQASTWADEIRRQRPNTASWHYVDIEIDQPGYSASRDCRNDSCIVAQLAIEEERIKNKSLLPSIRAESLKFLIHFVGDLHQPLHASDNHDRGGNETPVIIGRKRTNLHAIWDTAVVSTLGRNPITVSDRLDQGISQEEVQRWSRGTPIDWANETFEVSKTSVYSQFASHHTNDATLILSASYAKQNSAIVVPQLQRAGLRLALLLNEILQ